MNVARPHDLVPAGEHLAAEERAAPQRLLDLLARPARRPTRPARAGSSTAAPWAATAAATTPTRPGMLASAPESVRAISSERACASAASAVEPGAHRARAQPPDSRPSSSRLSGTTSSSVSPSPRSSSIARRCARDLARVRRHAVEHHRDDGAALARRLEQLPRDGVRVAGCGRDEEPGVGGGEQLVGERAVLVGDRVDVGRVEQGDALGERGGRHELQTARAAAVTAGRARELGQDASALEPAQILRIAGQHGRPRRRPQDARRAHLATDEAVDERRLARARRAADDHQERRVELAQARQQVVVDLLDELRARVPRRGRIR